VRQEFFSHKMSLWFMMFACRQIVFGGVILSTDDFFVNDDGIYQHDCRFLQQAHMWNQQRGTVTL